MFPPVAFTQTEPSVKLKQEGSVPPELSASFAGSVISIAVEVTQPLEAVTVTV